MTVAPARAPLLHAPSLARIPLRELSFPEVPSIHLDAEQSLAVLDGLSTRAGAAGTRLATSTRAALGARPDPAVALLHLMTHSRFRKGARSFAPVESAIEKVRHFTSRGAAVPVLLRAFPYKQFDSRLKATGPLPDLAEAGALLRLRELADSYQQLYPPGLRLTVLSDAGYYRPRPPGEVKQYSDELRTLTAQVGLKADYRNQGQAFRELCRDTWTDREDLADRLAGQIRSVIEPARPDFDGELAGRLLDWAGVLPLVTGTPPFGGLFRSLIYSSRIPGPADPEWSALVLDAVRDRDGELGEIRTAVLSQSWQEAIAHLAAAAADEQLGLWSALPHLRLSAIPRPGVIGYGHLGGSVLPWHGTGFVDHRYRLGADFAAVLRSSGAVPIVSEVFAVGQPWFLVAPEHVRDNVLCRGFADSIQLKSR